MRGVFVFTRRRDIISGGDDGHVHVLNFPPDMAGVPTMKVHGKYVQIHMSLLLLPRMFAAYDCASPTMNIARI